MTITPRDPSLSVELYQQRRHRLSQHIEQQRQQIKPQTDTDGVQRFVANNQWRELCLSLWDRWQLDYRAGCSLPDLIAEFHQLLGCLQQWQQASQSLRQQLQQEFPKRIIDIEASVLDFSQPEDYRAGLGWLSVALLLRDGVSVRQLIAAQASNQGQDALYELLLSAYLDDASDVDDCLHPDLGYDLLAELFFEPDPKLCQSLLGQYLDELDDSHYSWEAAAVCYLLDLPDPQPSAPFPQELLHYGRQLRELNQWTQRDPQDEDAG